MMNARTQLAGHLNRAEVTGALSFVIALALLIVSAKIQIPFWPVPLTMQTAVVLMLPCVLGVRMGVISIASYIGLGLAGYPVFAHAANAVAGPAYLAGPTGGYLVGFLLAGAAIGAVYARLGRSLNTGLLSLAMLAAHSVILMLGVAWLAFGLPGIGLSAAVGAGLVPFIAGSVIKSVFAALCVKSLNRA